MVSEESKAFANTVFLKKSMYYNMRSRIVKRHAGHVIRKVRHYLHVLHGSITRKGRNGMGSIRCRRCRQFLVLPASKNTAPV